MADVNTFACPSVRSGSDQCRNRSHLYQKFCYTRIDILGRYSVKSLTIHDIGFCAEFAGSISQQFFVKQQSNKRCFAYMTWAMDISQVVSHHCTSRNTM